MSERLACKDLREFSKIPAELVFLSSLGLQTVSDLFRKLFGKLLHGSPEPLKAAASHTFSCIVFDC